jgi:ABC-type uncharacterized transport system substrate-binding protein
MRRRRFISLLAGAAAAGPLAARAQSKPAIIGVLGSGFAASSAILIDLKQGMGENGLAEGRDYVLDLRWAEGDYTRFAALAAELTQHKSNLIIVTTIPAARAAQQAATALPQEAVHRIGASDVHGRLRQELATGIPLAAYGRAISEGYASTSACLCSSDMPCSS